MGDTDRPQSSPTVVLITGSGRSGTSSLAGSMARLGLHVPEPVVPPSETNPRGFYEPQWVIDFHKSHLKQLAVFNIDSRPTAVDVVDELVATGGPGAELSPWLAEQLPHAPLLIKDPHAFWFASLWRDASQQLGADLRWLTALRHPAEVVGSRDLAYLQSQTDELRRTKETSNVAGWVHAALLTERAGRDGRRAFIRYTDLLEDWRTAIGRVVGQLGLEVDADLAPGVHHPIDDFLDSSMRKSQLTWDDVRVHDDLRELAEEVWQLLGRLVEDPQDDAAIARLDELHETYRESYDRAVALTYDHTHAEATLARRQAREAQQQTVEDLRRKVRRLRERVGGGAGTPAGAPESDGASDGTSGEASGGRPGLLGRLRRS